MASDTAALTPAYLPWATFISALDNLQTHGIPGTGVLDKSLWDTQSGAMQGQIVVAFRFMGLIDEKNRVLPPLQPLVRAKSDERKPLLREIVEEKYRSVITRDLMTISSGQLEDAIRSLGVTGSTLERAVRFFIKACRELGIPLSKRFSEKVRSSGSPRKARRITVPRRESLVEEGGDQQAPPSRAWEDRLLEKFPTFDPAWPDVLKTKWFESFERLMRADKGLQGNGGPS